MDKLKTLNNKYAFPIILLLFWVVFTLKSPYFHQYYHEDVYWAYNIAANLNFIEIIKLMHYEGHTFLWYLILKPFTYFDILYPSIVKYINWIFCFGTMVLICLFAPIKNYLKFLITISFPFLYTYPTLGRDYGLTIFLLFLLTIFYKNRLQYPIKYAILLFICSNTCINGVFVSFILSCFFIYDLYINNNKKIGSVTTNG